MSDKVIFDIGLHKGEDSEYYLARGFRVVAVEANPDLVAYCHTRFKKYIDTNALTIIHGAVVEDDELQSIKFYKNNKVSVWGTVVQKWADRNAMLGADSVEIEVPVINFPKLFSRFGCPYYLKIDIEGMDLVCLQKLLKTECRPKYISIESEKVDFRGLVNELDTFKALGYGSFLLQQQVGIDSKKVPSNSEEGEYVDFKFKNGSSGPFGADLDSEWLTADQALQRYERIFRDYRWFGDSSLLRNLPLGRYLLSGLSKLAGRPLPGWYDTHARYE